MIDWLEALTFFAPWILVPALALALAPRGFRLMVLVLALAAGFVIPFAMHSGGPHDPLIILPFIGCAVALGVLLAELIALLIKRIGRSVRSR